MKKTLITLLALSGLAMSAELTYTGANDGWFEHNTNWTDVATGLTSSSKPVSGDTIIIDGGKTVKIGANSGDLANVNLTVKGNSTLVAKDAKHAITASVITIEKGSSVNLSAVSDYKIGKGTVWNVYSENGLILGNQWLDNTANQGTMTFNLGEEGSVHYSGLVDVNRSGSRFPGYVLTANCSAVIETGSMEIQIFKRELVTFTSSAVFNAADIDYLNSHLSGTFTCNGITLTQGDLTGACQYALAYDDTKNAIVLSYTAPEPATATLSLLALAGLAARRRK